MPFYIGADPEIFLTKAGKYISAETRDGPIIPGTKAKPFKVKGGAIQIDGVAAEFNVDPASNFKGFYENTKMVLQALRKAVHAKDPKVVLTPTPVAKFAPRYFQGLPRHTLELGCDPDFNAYTMKPNPRPQTNQPMRTGSGHVHLGWTSGADVRSDGHLLDCQLVVKELDKYLHFASLDWDKDTERAALYGAPGSFRPKPYGVEYRVLSNAWIKDPERVRNVFEISMAVLKSLDSGKHDLRANFSRDTRSNTDKVYSALSKHIYDL